MISHALFIIQKELSNHLKDSYPALHDVHLGNMAEGMTPGAGSIPRDTTLITVINIKEEKTLKNLPNYLRDDVNLKAKYQNPPVFINLLVLISATHGNYSFALTALSRAIRFFQYKKVFTQDNVLPALLAEPSIDVLDRLESFKLIFDLYSPTLEESNYMWGTLGGKQFPFAIYMMRMLDLKFTSVGTESGLITEVINDFYHKRQPQN